MAEHLACGGINRRKRPFGVEQPSVDQKALIGRLGTGCVTQDGGRFLHDPPQQASTCDGNFILILGESYIRVQRTQADAWNSVCLQLMLRQTIRKRLTSANETPFLSCGKARSESTVLIIGRMILDN